MHLTSTKNTVSADASQFAVGAVLLQSTSKGDWQSVEYASRKLTEAEIRYAMIEKESLAITCEKFDYYPVGRRFEIKTDHKPYVDTSVRWQRLIEVVHTGTTIQVETDALRLTHFSYTWS